MIQEVTSRGKPHRWNMVFQGFLILVALTLFWARPIRRWVRESFMQHVTSAHYDVLCPRDMLSQEAIKQFEAQRESLFMALDRKLGDAASNVRLRLIFDPDFPLEAATADLARGYSVDNTTIRTNLSGAAPQLDPAADAEALLYAAWGKPGSAQVGYWTSLWLVGDWHGQELGMAAAEAEQRVGYKKVAILLSQQPAGALSPQDRDLFGAAWLSEIEELAGLAQVRRLYTTKITKLDIAEVTKALGTTIPDLERKWQMWIYAYLAGMPAAPHSSGVPMNMPMSK